jgi:hypothetical protein
MREEHAAAKALSDQQLDWTQRSTQFARQKFAEQLLAQRDHDRALAALRKEMRKDHAALTEQAKAQLAAVQLAEGRMLVLDKSVATYEKARRADHAEIVRKLYEGFGADATSFDPEKQDYGDDEEGPTTTTPSSAPKIGN